MHLFSVTISTWGCRGGDSYMLADISFLSINPIFDANLTPNDPDFYYTPHPMTHFFQTFNVKYHFFRALCAHLENGKFTPKNKILHRKFPVFVLLELYYLCIILTLECIRGSNWIYDFFFASPIKTREDFSLLFL